MDIGILKMHTVFRAVEVIFHRSLQVPDPTEL
jgi:hypothetical protein